MKITHPFNVGIYGKPRSGKTTLIKQLLYYNIFQFNHVIIVSETPENYSYIKELNIKNIKYTMTRAINLDVKLRTIAENQNKLITSNKPCNDILLIFDDIMGLFKSSKYSTHLSSIYRHRKISLIYSFQSITGNDPNARTFHDHVFLFKPTDMRTLKQYHENFLPEFDNPRQVQKYIANGCYLQYSFLYINVIKDIKCFCLLSK